MIPEWRFITGQPLESATLVMQDVEGTDSPTAPNVPLELETQALQAGGHRVAAVAANGAANW